MALGRKSSAEPLSSEDMALLAAVAAQAATALENGRLYRQLTVKADELERMREFSENILESLNDGLPCSIATIASCGGIAASKSSTASATKKRSDAGSNRFSTPRSSRSCARDVASLPTAPQSTAFRWPRGMRRRAGCSSTSRRRRCATCRGRSRERSSWSKTSRRAFSSKSSCRSPRRWRRIGLLAAGVAHEVNTPLTGISSFVQMLMQGTDPEDPKTQVLEKIERQTFRAAKIVNGLLNLARPAQVDTGPVDVNAVINDVLSLLEHQMRTGRIQVRKELAATSPVVLGIEYKLQQVFLNLFLNARDAMPKGGWLSIVTPVVARRCDSRGRGHGFRHSRRSAVADLRPVLHDQGDRQGHGPRPVHHLRHRAGARRDDHLRQLHGPGDAIHADAAARVDAPLGTLARSNASSGLIRPV